MLRETGQVHQLRVYKVVSVCFFFFKQKTAYGISFCLVGSEKCKRDRDKRELAGLSLAETVDAMQVLSEGSLRRQIEPSILSARVRLLAARLTLEAARHQQVPHAIDRLLDLAARHLRGARSGLANPATLPPSFRN